MMSELPKGGSSKYEWEAANHQLRAVVTERSRGPPGRTLRVLPIALLGSHLAPLARQFSQRFAHSSTRWNAGGLICRVRDGYGSRPAAVAALMPIRGVEPRKPVIGGPMRSGLL